MLTQTTQRIDEGLLRRIDGIRLSERLAKRKEMFLAMSVQISAHRAVLVRESWEETDGLPIDIRLARRVAKLLDRLPIAIHCGELTVGNETEHMRGVGVQAEYCPGQQLKQLESKDAALGSTHHKGQAAAEDYEALEQVSRFFLDKSPERLVKEARRSLFGDWFEDLAEVRGWLPWETYIPGSTTPQWELLLSEGLEGITRRARHRIEAFRSQGEYDPEKLWFCQAVLIICEAVGRYARRYARLAADLAAVEDNPERRAELEKIALISAHVPEHPARTFHETVQAMRLFGAAALIEHNLHAGTDPGRLDQILYPYFRRECDHGLDASAEIVGEYIGHLGTLDKMTGSLRQQYAQSTQIINITLAGVKEDGTDACNELTSLILHMVGLQRYAEPHISFRWHPSIPKWAMTKALETNRRIGGGIPQFFSDQQIISYMVQKGVELQDARDYSTVGCVQTLPGGNSVRIDYKVIAVVNAALSVDLALHDGVAFLTGKRIGPETGDPRAFSSFAEFLEAYKIQHEFILRRVLQNARMAYRIEHQLTRCLVPSALNLMCLEKAIPNTLVERERKQGEPLKGMWDVFDRGNVDVGNSLMAVKDLVFDSKKLSMADLLEAIDSNFEGERGEEIRLLCLGAPKYGNGIEEVDRLVGEVGDFSASIIHSEKNPFGGPLTISRNGVAWHYFGGMGVAALPNGRKAKEPLSDGCLSPMRGTDRNGPTTVIRSALTADFREARQAVLNQRFPAALVQSEESLGKLAALTEAYLGNGGSHIQYNLLDARTLLEAKKHPELYKDLVVRVAGYSAYFVYLAPEVQDDVIARTEQSL